MNSSHLPQKTLCIPYLKTPHPQVLLGYKKAGFGAGKYAGFGGKVEAGESIAQAAARELFEECSLSVLLADLEYVAEFQFIFPSCPAWDQVVHLFLTQRWSGQPAESNEMRPAWFTIEAIPYAEMWQDARVWLPEVLQEHKIRACFTFEADQETVKSLQITPLFEL